MAPTESLRGMAGRSGETCRHERRPNRAPGAQADIGEDKTAGGIIIPDSAKEKPSQGEILSVRTHKKLTKIVAWLRKGTPFTG